MFSSHVDANEHRTLAMVALVAAGSAIYDLPYFFLGPLRPTALEVFGLSNTSAGIVMAVYGLFNLVLYLPGGSIADAFPPRTLIIVGLLLTGMGGFYMATLPSFLGLCCLLFAWSLSSILVYWAAFIRSVRDRGQAEMQGWSWATYSASTGIVGAIKIAFIVEYFSTLLPDGAEAATFEEKKNAIQVIVCIYSVLPFVAAVLVALLLLPNSGSSLQEPHTTGRPPVLVSSTVNHVHVYADTKVWLMACMLLAIYFCLSVNFYFPQFAMNGYGIHAVGAARIGAMGAWIKPIAALAAGRVADHIRCSTVCAASLSTLMLLFAYMGTQTPQPGNLVELVTYVVLANVAGESISSIFWAILQEARVPDRVTGAVVGFVSFIGYSPDAFSPPLLGYIMDSYPGLLGNQRSMLVGAGFAAFGLASTLWLSVLVTKSEQDGDKSMEDLLLFRSDGFGSTERVAAQSSDAPKCA